MRWQRWTPPAAGSDADALHALQRSFLATELPAQLMAGASAMSAALLHHKPVPAAQARGGGGCDSDSRGGWCSAFAALLVGVEVELLLQELCAWSEPPSATGQQPPSVACQQLTVMLSPRGSTYAGDMLAFPHINHPLHTAACSACRCKRSCHHSSPQHSARQQRSCVLLLQRPSRFFMALNHQTAP